MNRKLTDRQIVSTFEALSQTGMPVSGRVLRAHFGSGENRADVCVARCASVMRQRA